MKTKVNKLVVPAILASMLVATPSFAYTVKSGDTMSEIAVDNNLSLQELSLLNPQVRDVDFIYAGQSLNTSGNPSINNSTNFSINVTTSEKALMARLVEAEAKGEPFAGKVAVVDVVLNRVKSGSFPNTIQGVIYQAGQFSPVSNGSIYNTPSEASIQAVEEALRNNGGNGSLYFYNPITADSHWLDGMETTTRIGNHIFKK